jgi:NAD(P)H-hydrate epimerase
MTPDLSLRPLTRDKVRDIDRRAIEEYGLPGVVLMENAGRGAAELLMSRGVSGPVVICCGRGNNGGDGFVIARHLELAGCDVRIVLLGDAAELRGDAAINYRVVERSGLPIDVWPLAAGEFEALLASADWIVDALLGTGAQGSVREPFASAIEGINRADRKVLAVDLPSGMDCDTGRPLGPCVRAMLTATFVAPKAGFVEPAASDWTGEVVVVDIGAPLALLAEISEPRT